MSVRCGVYVNVNDKAKRDPLVEGKNEEGKEGKEGKEGRKGRSRNRGNIR